MRNPTPQLERFSYLVEAIYDAAIMPLKWGQVVSDIADYLDAAQGFLFTPVHAPKDGGFLFSCGVAPSFYERWPRFMDQDVPGQIAQARGVFKIGGTVVTGEMLMPTANFRATSIYRNFFSHYDMAYMMGSMVFGTEEPDYLPTSFNCYRGQTGRPFSTHECQRLRLVLPHLSRALGVMHRLRDTDLRIASSRAALDRLGRGVLLVDRGGHVVFANRPASLLLAEEDGLRLQRLYGAYQCDTLQAADAGTHRAVQQAMGEASAPDIHAMRHEWRSVMVPRPTGRPPYVLHFAPLSHNNEFGLANDAPRAIVFVSETGERLGVSMQLLCSAYGLTPAEARTALSLTDGGSLQDVARRLGLSVNTLKAQLRQIYGKTETGDRVRLVRLLIALSHPT